MRSLRIRTIVIASAVGGAALAALLIGVATMHRVHAEIGERAAWSAAAPEVLLETFAAIIVAGGVALVLAALGGARVGRHIEARIGELRSAVVRMTERPGDPMPPSGGIAELEILATAIARLCDARTAGERDLRRDRDGIVALIDNVSEGIVQIDAAGRIVRSNRAGRRLLGLAPGAESPRIATTVRHTELRRRLTEAATAGATEGFECAIEGRRVFVSTRPAEDGSVVLLVDLTELRRLEDVRRDFVANASHELKTPLTSIRGYTETLLQDDLPPEMRRQFLETVRANARRLQRVVDDLLDLSRIESGRWRPQLQPIGVRDAARDAWAECGEAAGAKEIAFVLPDSDPCVVADAFALGRIFSNLFENAIRYTPAGGSIAVAAREDPASAMVVVEVRDTGSGIPRDALPRIFERFYRVDPARSREAGGTGLGLAIVRHLVETMGGSIAAESELGRGTTIRFLLPRA